jgi:hypothetical protein
MKKLLLLVLLVAVIGAIAKAVESQKKEWTGLTESQARAKLNKRIGNRMPAERKAQVTDRVVAKMKSHGHLKKEASA